MKDLHVGLQIFHNGIPIQLLYRIDKNPKPNIWQIWRVQPLFVVAEERNERFGYYDSISRLHTMRAGGVP